MEAIKLNDNYRIEKDAYSWTLIFSEEREKENKKTLLKEKFIFEDKWYYPDIKQVLNKFIDLDCKDAESIKELSDKMEAIKITIDELKNTIFKPNNK